MAFRKALKRRNNPQRSFLPSESTGSSKVPEPNLENGNLPSKIPYSQFFEWHLRNYSLWLYNLPGSFIIFAFFGAK